jgi:tRNA A-37 threonylcarbamoyl transferase component Bud32
MEHIEDGAGCEGARGMALMWCDIKHLARAQNVRDAGDRQFEGAAKKQGPLLMRVGVIGDDGTRSDVDSALGNVVRVKIAAEVARSDLTRRYGCEVKQSHGNSSRQAGLRRPGARNGPERGIYTTTPPACRHRRRRGLPFLDRAEERPQPLRGARCAVHRQLEVPLALLDSGHYDGSRLTLPELYIAEQLASLQVALAGRYTIEREIGRGGMAMVYLADDLKHHRRVAIKILRPELAAVLGTERFLREIETVARLNHPHILPLHDSGECGGVLYFVMPFIDGVSLRLRLEGGRRLGVDQALAIAAPVADALSYAHRMGVLHRDVKPENILFSQGHPIVADFGIAKAISTAGGVNLTHAGLALGTPGYMSPEQAAGLTDLDERSDVYSLAIVIYEMLVGQVPGSWPMEDALSPGQFIKVPASHRSRLTEAGSRIEGALVRGLAIQHEERTPTPAALIADLTGPASPQGRFAGGDLRAVVERAAEGKASSKPTAWREGPRVGVATEVVRAAGNTAQDTAAPTDTAPPRNRWLGGPTIVLFERLVEGEIPDTGYQTVADEIRSVLNIPGQVSQLGRSFSWGLTRGWPPWRDVGVAVSVRGGHTRIMIRENLLYLLIPIVGFGAAGVTVGLSQIVEMFGGALDTSGAGGWGIRLAWSGAIFLASRITYQQVAKRRTRELMELADRLVTLARELAERPALPN